jgi:hypothetical protein
MKPDKNLPPKKPRFLWLQIKIKNTINTIKNTMEIAKSTFLAFFCVIFIIFIFATRSNRSEYRPRRRRRRGQPRQHLAREGACFWCGSLVEIGDELTPLLGHTDCPCMTRGMPPTYRVRPRDVPPGYGDEEMAPPYEA